MASITSAGIGSGLDVAGLAEQLVAAEGQPARSRLDRKEAGEQASLSALGTFKGALTDFQSTLPGLRDGQAFQALNVSADVEDYVTAAVSQDAQPGSFNVDVRQLAQAQRLTSDNFGSDKEPLGSGTLTFQFGRYDSETKRFIVNPDRPVQLIVIAPGNNTLRGIREAVDSAGIGIRASLINGGDGFYLVLSSQVTGVDNSIRLTVSDDDGTDTDLFGLSRLAYNPDALPGQGANLNETIAAQDALIDIDGITVAKGSNTITDVMAGISFDLHAVSEGTQTHFDLTRDDAGIVEGIEAFIKSYNEFIQTISSLTGYDPEAGKAGPLAGDASIRAIANQLRTRIGSTFEATNFTYTSLSSIGITTERDGSLKLDAVKLQDALATDRQQVARIFVKTGNTTDPHIRYLGAGDNTAMGIHEVFISQLAQRGHYVVDEPLFSFPITVDERNHSLEIKVNGVSSETIILSHRDYDDGEQFAQELQNRINEDSILIAANASVSVEFVNDQIVIYSDLIGSASRVDIVEVGFYTPLTLGLAVGQGRAGVDVAGTIGGIQADGSGNILSGTRAVEGLAIEITGGEVGKRGEVMFARGVADQIHKLLNDHLDEDGVIRARTEGFDERIEDIKRQREVLERRLALAEERYLKQFSTLDAVLGKLQSTSSFLSNQLAVLPTAKHPR